MTPKFIQAKIGGASIDFRSSLITNAEGGIVTIEPKVMQVLQVLAQRHGQVISRDELIDLVWDNTRGADEGLTRAISLLRKAFGNSPEHKRYIRTVPKRGYILSAPLVQVEVSTSELPIKAFTPPPLSLAVLSFADLSVERNLDYLCDGISEEIINKLTHITSLKVSGRISSFLFKERDRDVCAIAQALNVAYILEGSIRRDGDETCITVQLIEGVSGYRLSSNIYKGDTSNLFKFQEHVGRMVANHVTESLNIDSNLNDTAYQQTETGSVSTEAYQLFLRGKQLTHQLNGQMIIPMGIDLLQQAIDLEPDFDEAWSWKALAHFILPEFSSTNQWQYHIQQSHDAVEKALALNNESCIAWLVKGMHLMRNLKFDESLVCHERALELDPNNIETMAGMGLGLMAIGAHERAKHYFLRVIENDPLCGIWYCNLGNILLQTGEFEAAENSFIKSFKLGFGAAAFGVSYVMSIRGKKDEAAAFMKDNYHALGPIEKETVQTKLTRKLIINALLKRKPLARKIVSFMSLRRLNDTTKQPNTVSLLSFFWMDKPGLFLKSILNKPNPYLGYTTASVWETTDIGKRVRQHPDFTTLVQNSNLIASWEKYGWPDQVRPDDNDSGFRVVA